MGFISEKEEGQEFYKRSSSKLMLTLKQLLKIKNIGGILILLGDHLATRKVSELLKLFTLITWGTTVWIGGRFQEFSPEPLRVGTFCSHLLS